MRGGQSEKGVFAVCQGCLPARHGRQTAAVWRCYCSWVGDGFGRKPAHHYCPPIVCNNRHGCCSQGAMREADLRRGVQSSRPHIIAAGKSLHSFKRKDKASGPVTAVRFNGRRGGGSTRRRDRVFGATRSTLSIVISQTAPPCGPRPAHCRHTVPGRPVPRPPPCLAVPGGRLAFSSRSVNAGTLQGLSQGVMARSAAGGRASFASIHKIYRLH